MKKIRFWSLFVATLLLLPVFTGCGGAPIETESPETEEPKAEGIKLRVATANIGDFTGNKEPKADPSVVKATLDSMNADLVATQEDLGRISHTKQQVKETLYTGFPYSERTGTGDYNYKAYLSKYELRDTVKVYYEFPEGFDKKITHPWFLYTNINVEGIDVHFINIHVEWRDNEARREQLYFILDYIEEHNFEYCVVIGDFNPSNYKDDVSLGYDSDMYKKDLQAFKDEKFKMANGGEFGEFDTILDSDGVSVCDNILVTPNINITGVERVAEDWMNDHAFLIADLEIMK